LQKAKAAAALIGNDHLYPALALLDKWSIFDVSPVSNHTSNIERFLQLDAALLQRALQFLTTVRLTHVPLCAEWLSRLQPVLMARLPASGRSAHWQGPHRPSGDLAANKHSANAPEEAGPVVRRDAIFLRHAAAEAAFHKQWPPHGWQGQELCQAAACAAAGHYNKDQMHNWHPEVDQAFCR
jgi:hypothetical protein